MPHDIDHATAYFAHRDANLPQPNFIAVNPENGHGHSAVLLATGSRVIQRHGLNCALWRSSGIARRIAPIAITSTDRQKSDVPALACRVAT
jgi:hypothetical protein